MTQIPDGTFTFHRMKSGDVSISFQNNPVTRLRGAAADTFIRKMDRANPDGAQQIMARVTGNFKRGNERSG